MSGESSGMVPRRIHQASSAVESYLDEWSAGCAEVSAGGELRAAGEDRKAAAVRGLLAAGCAVTELAAMLGVSEGYVRKLNKRGEK